MPSELGEHWSLAPGLDFLNHGSFGATPRRVLDAQQAWRDRIEAEPVAFYVRDLEPALDEARSMVAGFVGAEAEDLVFVRNATTGINAVLRSLALRPGDELLTTDHAYKAVHNALEVVASAAGARVVIAAVPFPLASADDVVAPVLDAVTARTRLAVIDHVTSATALRFPIEQLAPALAERGVDLLVDGAHAPGAIGLDVAAIGATYYAANLHKWVCAPKGAGFLWVRRDRQPRVHPVVVSHRMNSPRRDRSAFLLEFDWTGTDDPSPCLAAPEAIRFGEELFAGGWAELRHRNHELALAGRELLCGALGVEPPAPESMIGSMASIPMPPTDEPPDAQRADLYEDPLHLALVQRGIQVMIAPWPQRPNGRPWRRLIRISAAAYNELAQYERLAAALREIVQAAP